MSSSSLDSRGLIGNAVTGYRLAWIHRRQLLLVVPPVLAPTLLGLVLLDLLLGRDQMAIINGGLTVHGDGGILAWAKLGLTAASWLLALTAGTLTVAGALRGQTVRPIKAILAACKQFPVLAVGLCAAGGASFLVLWVLAGVAGAAGGPPGLTLVIGALVMAALVTARILLGVASQQLGGSAWGLTRGRVASTAGAFLLGGIMVPLLVGYPRDQLRSVVSWPFLAEAIDAILLTGVVAAQAGILAHAYLLPRDETRSCGQESADLAIVDARLAPLAGGSPRRAWLGVAALMAPVLLSTGVAVANPYDAPSVRSHDDAPAGRAVAVAWPAGQHPVIVNSAGAWFCDNDLCDRYVNRDGGPVVMDGWGTADVGPDGTVIKAAVTGSEDNGSEDNDGPFIHYARCTRDGCRQAWLPVHASAKEPFGWPELAVSSAPDGAIWFALAMPSPDDQPGKPTYRISLIRCPDTDCATPQRHQVGTVERTPADDYPDARRARLSLGADGRPVAAFWIGWRLLLVTCEPVTCARPQKSRTAAGPPDALWATPVGLGDAAVSFRPGQLRIGKRLVPLVTAEAAPQSGALAVTGSHIYATAAVSTNRASGLHVTVGTPREHWQQILWSCEQTRCRRHPLDVFQGPARREMLAVGADGRVLIVRDDRITLITLRTAD